MSLHIDGHHVQLLPSQQTVLNVDASQSDFIQLPYASSDQFQQQLGSVSMVSYCSSVECCLHDAADLPIFLFYFIMPPPHNNNNNNNKHDNVYGAVIMGGGGGIKR